MYPYPAIICKALDQHLKMPVVHRDVPVVIIIIGKEDKINGIQLQVLVYPQLIRVCVERVGRIPGDHPEPFHHPAELSGGQLSTDGCCCPEKSLTPVKPCSINIYGWDKTIFLYSRFPRTPPFADRISDHGGPHIHYWLIQEAMLPCDALPGL